VLTFLGALSADAHLDGCRAGFLEDQLTVAARRTGVVEQMKRSARPCEPLIAALPRARPLSCVYGSAATRR
jgi:hypothetical protein